MSRRRPRLFDNRGKFLGDAAAPAPSEGWGAYAWEFLHPGQVQQEYAAAGASSIPSAADIMGTAAEGIAQSAADTVTNVEAAASSALDTGKWVLVAVLGLAGLYLLTRFSGR